MFVKNYMTTEPVSIRPDVLILDARKILQEKEFRHLPVTDASGVLQGMVTDRDIRSALPSSVASPEEREKIMARVKDTLVSEIMSENLSTLGPDSTLDDALMLLLRSNVGAVPVIDNNGVLEGIFSIRDLMGAYGNLFGLGEKGSFLITVRAGDGPDVIARVAGLLDDQGISVTRIVREEAPDGGVYLHLRVNTFNLRAVHSTFASAGFDVVSPLVM